MSTPAEFMNEMKEEEEQAALFAWAGMASGKYPDLALMFHIPNGGYRTKSEAGRFRAQGVKSGVPDIFLPVARGDAHGLFIEMKRMTKGRVSGNQTDWINALRNNGYVCAVAYGWLMAKDIIIKYLEGSNEDQQNSRRL